MSIRSRMIHSFNPRNGCPLQEFPDHGGGPKHPGHDKCIRSRKRFQALIRNEPRVEAKAKEANDAVSASDDSGGDTSSATVSQRRKSNSRKKNRGNPKGKKRKDSDSADN